MKKLKKIEGPKGLVDSAKKGLPDEYWHRNYEDPECMDGIYNDSLHASYLKSLFSLEEVPVRSMIDLGLGPGAMFVEFIKAFRPQKWEGLEPSSYAFRSFKEKVKGANLPGKGKLRQMSLQDWAQESEGLSSKQKMRPYDLGICHSVFQYIGTDELASMAKALSERCRFVYFSVPTSLEYRRQRIEMEFEDPYALERSKALYLKALRPYFTIVGSRVLESKVFYNSNNSPFADHLFRY